MSTAYHVGQDGAGERIRSQEQTPGGRTMSQTPGPWTIAAALSPDEEVTIVSHQLGRRNGEQIAMVFASDPVGIGHANAHLIAAAPEMLVMLKQFVDAYKECGKFGADIVTDALEIIRHAEGQDVPTRK